MTKDAVPPPPALLVHAARTTQTHNRRNRAGRAKGRVFHVFRLQIVSCIVLQLQRQTFRTRPEHCFAGSDFRLAMHCSIRLQIDCFPRLSLEATTLTYTRLIFLVVGCG